MPQFKIVVEVGTTHILEKSFDGETLEDAMQSASAEAWDGPNASGWIEVDSNSVAEIREELCTGAVVIDNLESLPSSGGFYRAHMANIGYADVIVSFHHSEKWTVKIVHTNTKGTIEHHLIEAAVLRYFALSKGAL